MIIVTIIILIKDIYYHYYSVKNDSIKAIFISLTNIHNTVVVIIMLIITFIFIELKTVFVFSIHLNHYQFILNSINLILISIIFCQSLRGFEKKEKTTEPIRASYSYHSVRIMI